MAITMDTPNSRINRKIEFNYDLDFANEHLDIGINTPFVAFDINGKLYTDMFLFCLNL